MINLYKYRLLKDNLDSLKETSKDSSDPGGLQYMTNLDMKVVNFDSVKTKYANINYLSEEVAKSIDAIIHLKKK